MADQQQQQQQQQQHSPDNKLQPVCGTKKPTAALTNIYYDCLERIFEFLDLKSLFNVALTCKRLQIGAATNFGDKFGKKRIMMTVRGNSKRFQDNNVISFGNVIRVSGLLYDLAFLRCFGVNITDLHITQCCSDAYIALLYEYLNKYCADSLVSLSIHGDHIAWKSHAEKFSKPFKNVQRIEMSSIILGKQLSKFTDLFPKLRDLHLHSVHYVNDESVAINFPHLSRLIIPLGRMGFTSEYGWKLLQANRQIEHLEIHSADADQAISKFIFLAMISECRSLTTLKTSLMFNNSIVNKANLLSSFADKHPSLVELDLSNLKFTAQTAQILIGKLNSLKRFEFSLMDRSEHNHLINQLDSKWQHQSQFFPSIHITLNC